MRRERRPRLWWGNVSDRPQLEVLYPLENSHTCPPPSAELRACWEPELRARAWESPRNPCPIPEDWGSVSFPVTLTDPHQAWVGGGKGNVSRLSLGCHCTSF